MTGDAAGATAEVEAAIERLFTYAAWADKYDGAVHDTPLRNVTLAMNEPIGVIGIVCPDECPLLALRRPSWRRPSPWATRVVAVPSERHPLAATDFYQVLETSRRAGRRRQHRHRRARRAGEDAGRARRRGRGLVLRVGGGQRAWWSAPRSSNLKQTWVGYGRPLDFDRADARGAAAPRDPGQEHLGPLRGLRRTRRRGLTAREGVDTLPGHDDARRRLHRSSRSPAGRSPPAPRRAAAAEASRPPRAALFRAAGFPTVDAPAIDDATLATALVGPPGRDASTRRPRSASRLKRADHDVLVLPYGSAFPLEAWPAIRDFVKQGGGLVVLGGAPFHQPVRQEKATRYVLGPAAADLRARAPDRARPTSSTRRAFAGPMKTVAVAGGEWDGAAAGAEEDVGAHGAPRDERGHARRGRLGRARATASCARSSTSLDAKGVARLCPLLEIDRLRGTEAGRRAGCSRPSDARLDAGDDPRAVRARARGRGRARRAPRARGGRAGRGADPARHPAPAGAARRRGGPVARARDASATTPGPRCSPARSSSRARARCGPASSPCARRPRCRPGLYHAEVATPDAPWHPRAVTTGFWVKDEKLLAAGPKLSVSRDWLRARRQGAAGGRARPTWPPTSTASSSSSRTRTSGTATSPT